MHAASTKILLAGLALLFVAAPACGQQPPKYRPEQICVLVTTNMCCSHESGPAIKEMSKVPGVAHVVPDHKTRSLTIIATKDVLPSPLAIWEAAERAELTLVGLHTSKGVYKTKPKPQPQR
jgi:hypothetical protein